MVDSFHQLCFGFTVGSSYIQCRTIHVYFSVCVYWTYSCVTHEMMHVIPWLVSCRRIQIRTWLFRKCLGHQKDHTCGSTKYLFLTWMRKKWRKWCRRVWLSTAAHQFAHVLRRSVSYLLGHPSVRPATNVKWAYLLALHMFSLAQWRQTYNLWPVMYFNRHLLTYYSITLSFVLQCQLWVRLAQFSTAPVGWRSCEIAFPSSLTTRLWRLKRWCTSINKHISHSFSI